MSTDTATYTSGQAPTLIATLGNPTGPTCKLARSAANEIWTVKSGPPTVWTTQGCPSTTTSIPKQMKIASGATKRLSMQWNGHLRSSSCQDLGVALAGTYTAMASIDGVAVPAKKAAIFHITG
jgi:hypothetical protein